MDYAKVRDDILLATLPQVAFDGWGERSLRQGTADAGYAPNMMVRAFPAGVVDAVRHWSAWADRRMLEEMGKRNLEAMRLRDRVIAAVRTRIEVVSPYREAVRRTIAFLALPTRVTVGASLTYGTVNAIWYAAGDTAADFSFYTKRALLASVYVSTVLYWLDDESDEFADTWSFLERRIDDVLQVPKLGSWLTDLVPSPPGWLSRTRRPLRRRST